jgi:GntR family transcriptional repressor for pyruvate dehydrogenase complex
VRNLPEPEIESLIRARRRSPMVQHPKTGERVAQQVISDVTDRGFEPGDPLPSETEMMSAYRVGRAAVREALRILETNGIVSIRTGQNGGPRLSAAGPSGFAHMATLHMQLAGATFRDLAELRRVIKPILAEQAAVRGDEPSLEIIRGVLQMEQWAATAKDFTWLSCAFHDAIDDAAGNPALALVSKGFSHIWVNRVLVAFGEVQIEMVTKEQLAIGEAICIGDGTAARHLMEEYLDNRVSHTREIMPFFLDEEICWT